MPLGLVSPQPFPLVSSSRWLKKRGELAFNTEELSIWRAFSNKSYYLFLFNDVLIVTKKKRSEVLNIMDFTSKPIFGAGGIHKTLNN